MPKYGGELRVSTSAVSGCDHSVSLGHSIGQGGRMDLLLSSGWSWKGPAVNTVEQQDKWQTTELRQ